MQKVFIHLKRYFEQRHRILSVGILCLFAVYISASTLAQPVNSYKFDIESLIVDSIPTTPKKDAEKRPRQKGEPMLVKIEKADLILKKEKDAYTTLRHNVVLYHDGAYLYCDSAYYNGETNSFEAFSNVRMVQGDTIFLNGKYMHYNGNTMLARVRHNVVLEHRTQSVKLYTDSLDYDRARNIGYYPKNGKLIDTLNVLTSRWGQYEPNKNLATFRDSVKLVNPNFVMYSKILEYNTQSRIANILSESKIVSDSGIIYTNNGFYDTNTEESLLLDRSIVVTNDGNKTLTGDSIFYDKVRGYGRAYGNVQLQDTARKVILRGNYVYYNELTNYAMATDSAYCIEYSQGDSLYIHGDTLKMISYTEEVRIPSAADSLDVVDRAISDSMNIVIDSMLVNTMSKDRPKPQTQILQLRDIKAYYGVRFYRSDMQGVCDSLQFSSRDSIIHLIREPVIWNEKNQISGDTIDIVMSDSSINFVHVKKYSFSIEQKDSVMYNQMKGRSLKAFFENGQVRRILIEGNAESIFYPEDKDKSIIGLNWLQSGYLEIFLKEGGLEKMVSWPQPIGKMTPTFKVQPDQRRLEGFYWFDYLRPLDAKDIFRKVSKKETDVRLEKDDIFDFD